jgi:hypothetical protein
VETTLITPERDFVYRPLSVAEPGDFENNPWASELAVNPSIAHHSGRETRSSY